MNAEIRKFLESVRYIVAFISQMTPTEYDDQIVKWIDYILGDAPLPLQFRAQASIPWDKLPWDQILPIILPILLDLLSKWLAKIGGGATLPPAPSGLMFNDKKRPCG